MNGEVIAALIAIGLSLLFTMLVVKIVNIAASKMKNSNEIYFRFIKNILIAVIYIIGFSTCMSFIPGLSKLTSTILAGSGILAAILGLAAQESFGNIFSGIFISMFRPFNIGDRVHLVNCDISGYIEDITLRHTVIKTFVNSRVVVPNSKMASEVIENSDFTSTGASSFVDVYVSYECDLDLAIQVMADVIGSNELYLDKRTQDEIENNVPKVKVYIRELGESGIGLRASMWTKSVDENFNACSEARLALLKEFKRFGIEIPYNKLVIVEQ